MLVKKFIVILAFPLLLVANLAKAQLKTGAEMMNEYLPLLMGKSVGVVSNHTSLVNGDHLVDTLLKRGVDIKSLFSPEHGFLGDASDGAEVKDGTYKGIKIISLYGKHKKPRTEDLKTLDYVVFDMQDVGVRFYTYISTMTYVMEACAENAVKMLVLDRPNPNGYFIDGPVLDPVFKSFVGMHTVPVVYGMTIGEYARMVNGEGWLAGGVKCDLKVIKLKAYNRNKPYELPVAPSPNLQSFESVMLYPSLCFFEGTEISVGRGTEYPFEVIGRPGFEKGNFSFTPVSIPGVSDHPKYEGQECQGFYLKDFAGNFIINHERLYLYWLIDFYKASDNKDEFFTTYFDKLAGTDLLRKQIIAGKSPDEIRASWESGIRWFLTVRKKYLLYPDFSSKTRMIEIRR